MPIAWFQMVETPAPLRSFRAFCPWNHLNTKNAWTPNAHNENVSMRAIMSDGINSDPGQERPTKAAAPRKSQS